MRKLRYMTIEELENEIPDFEEEIKDYARAEILEHKDEYLGGYTRATDDSIEEVYMMNKDVFVDLWLEEKGIEIVEEEEEDDTE